MGGERCGEGGGGEGLAVEHDLAVGEEAEGGLAGGGGFCSAAAEAGHKRLDGRCGGVGAGRKGDGEDGCVERRCRHLQVAISPLAQRERCVAAIAAERGCAAERGVVAVAAVVRGEATDEVVEVEHRVGAVAAEGGGLATSTDEEAIGAVVSIRAIARGTQRVALVCRSVAVVVEPVAELGVDAERVEPAPRGVGGDLSIGECAAIEGNLVEVALEPGQLSDAELDGRSEGRAVEGGVCPLAREDAVYEEREAVRGAIPDEGEMAPGAGGPEPCCGDAEVVAAAASGGRSEAEEQVGTKALRAAQPVGGVDGEAGLEEAVAARIGRGKVGSRPEGDGAGGAAQPGGSAGRAIVQTVEGERPIVEAVSEVGGTEQGQRLATAAGIGGGGACSVAEVVGNGGAAVVAGGAGTVVGAAGGAVGAAVGIGAIAGGDEVEDLIGSAVAVVVVAVAALRSGCHFADAAAPTAGCFAGLDTVGAEADAARWVGEAGREAGLLQRDAGLGVGRAVTVPIECVAALVAVVAGVVAARDVGDKEAEGVGLAAYRGERQAADAVGVAVEVTAHPELERGGLGWVACCVEVGEFVAVALAVGEPCVCSGAFGTAEREVALIEAHGGRAVAPSRRVAFGAWAGEAGVVEERDGGAAADRRAGEPEPALAHERVARRCSDLHGGTAVHVAGVAGDEREVEVARAAPVGAGGAGAADAAADLGRSDRCVGGDRRTRGTLVVGGAGRVDEGGRSAGHGEVSVELLSGRYGDGGVAGDGRAGGRLTAAEADRVGRAERAELPAIFDEGVVGPAPGDAADGGAGLRQIGGRRELREGVAAHHAWRRFDAVAVAGGNLQIPAVVTCEREVVAPRGNPVGIDGRDGERGADFAGRCNDAHGGEIGGLHAGRGVAHAGDGGGGNADGAGAKRRCGAAGGPGGRGEERGLGGA